MACLSENKNLLDLYMGGGSEVDGPCGVLPPVVPDMPDAVVETPLCELVDTGPAMPRQGVCMVNEEM